MNKFVQEILEQEIEKYEIKKEYAERTYNKKEFEKSTTVLYFLRYIFLKELKNINLSIEEILKHFKGLLKFLKNEDLEAYNELNGLLNSIHSKIAKVYSK